jgi:hypothetical protein
LEELNVLEEHYWRTQAARDKYGPLEDSLDVLEYQLGREEDQLMRLQSQLLQEDDLLQLRNKDSNCLLSITNENNLDPPDYTVYNKYLSRLGDSDLIREELEDMRSMNKILQEQLESRQRFGLRLPEEDELSLANFPTKEAKLLEELQEIEAATGHIRAKCVRLLKEDEVEIECFNILENHKPNVDPLAREVTHLDGSKLALSGPSMSDDVEPLGNALTPSLIMPHDNSESWLSNYLDPVMDFDFSQNLKSPFPNPLPPQIQNFTADSDSQLIPNHTQDPIKKFGPFACPDCSRIFSRSGDLK